MNKTKLFGILALVLAGLNVFLLISTNKKTDVLQHPHEKPGNFIEQELGFSEDQKKQFQQLIREHQQQMRPLSDQLRDTRKAYFDILKEETPNADNNQNKADSINRRIGQLHQELNRVNFEHFKDIRGICTPSQIENYTKLLEKMGQRIGGPPPPRGGQKRRRGNMQGPPPPGGPH